MQASRDAIFSVVDSLAVTLDVGGVFKGVPAGPSYALRTVVCYFGHHYQVQRPGTSFSLTAHCHAVHCGGAAMLPLIGCQESGVFCHSRPSILCDMHCHAA